MNPCNTNKQKQKEMDDPLFNPLADYYDDEEGEDPLNHNGVPPQPTSAVAAAPTFQSLLSQNALLEGNNRKPITSQLRGRLAALKQDLEHTGEEEDEQKITAKLENAKTRRWVMEQLQRDIWLYWERGERSLALRCVCLLAGSLVNTGEDHSIGEWQFVTQALERFAVLLQQHFVEIKVSTEVKQAWFLQISHIRGLIPRLYVQCVTWNALTAAPETKPPCFVEQSRGISNAVQRMYFLAFLCKVRQRQQEKVSLQELFMFVRGRKELALPLCLVLTNHQSLNDFCECMKQTCASKSGCSSVGIESVLLVSHPDVLVSNTRLVLEIIHKCIAEQQEQQCGARLISCFVGQLLLATQQVTMQWDEGKQCMDACWQLLHLQQKQEVGAIEACAKFVQFCSTKREAVEETQVFLNHLCQLILYSATQQQEEEMIHVERALRAIVLMPNNRTILSSDAYYKCFDSLRLNKLALGREILLRFSNEMDLLPLALECAKQCKADSPDMLQFVQKCITRIDFDRENHFTLLVDLRRAFSHSQRVIKSLIMAMCWLAVKHVDKGASSDFLCACIGFCHATAPSLQDVMERGFTFAHVALVAARVGRLKQCDALFKAAIQCLAVLPSPEQEEEEDESKRLELCRCLASTLVVAPGHPHAFYLIQGFSNAVLVHKWRKEGEALLTVLDLVECTTRLQLPYHIAGNRVDSNDVLYGDADLASEAVKLASVVRARIASDFVHLLPACSTKLKRIQTNLQLRKQQVLGHEEEEEDGDA